MSDENERKALHAYLSDDAHEKWHGFAAEQGVSVSAVLEALSSELDLRANTAAEPVKDRLQEVVIGARKIDALRRRRRR